MTKREQPNIDKGLEAYLDGLINEPDREDFEREADSERRAQVNLQTRIDESLRRLFPVNAGSEEHLQEVADAICYQPVALPLYRRPVAWISGLVAAASIAVIITFSSSLNAPRPQPFFSPTPVAELYQKAVKNGFEPYYECRDDARFTAVFARRQGIPLQLLPMPDGSRMLGLSYPGGLSRNTTAMLCEVDEQPVMVFVDRLEKDQEVADRQAVPSIEWNVFRSVRDGLVFYEVSPFEVPRVAKYLVVASTPLEGQ